MSEKIPVRLLKKHPIKRQIESIAKLLGKYKLTIVVDHMGGIMFSNEKGELYDIKDIENGVQDTNETLFPPSTEWYIIGYKEPDEA